MDLLPAFTEEELNVPPIPENPQQKYMEKLEQHFKKLVILKKKQIEKSLQEY